MEVPSDLLILIASPRPPHTPYLDPCPAHIACIRTAQERARYLRRLVDRHVYKAGEPVDDDADMVPRAVDTGARAPYAPGLFGCGEPVRACGRPGWRLVQKPLEDGAV
jgi:hypothetical protein